MTAASLQDFLNAAKRDDVYAQTAAYLQRHFNTFLRRQERVLICWANSGAFSPASLAERTVRAVGAIPLLWGPDYRWRSLLKQAFMSHATAIIGPPMVILGLTKLARYTNTPLSIRNVILGGAPCEHWMLEGIQNGLDAKIWGGYDPIPGLAMAGFSCREANGVHLRTDTYHIQIVDEFGQPLPDGEQGNVMLQFIGEPSASFITEDRARMIHTPCKCGDSSPRLTDFRDADSSDPALSALRERLLSWSSILDYRAIRTEKGLSLEVVCFPGQRLPELPSCAKLNLHAWDPGRDMPLCMRSKQVFWEND